MKFFYLLILFSLFGGVIAKNTIWFSHEISLVLLTILTVWFYFFSRVRTPDIQLTSDIKKWIFLVVLFALLNILPELISFFQGEPYEGKKVGLVERHLHVLFIIMIVFLGFTMRVNILDLWKLLILSSGFVLYVILFEFYFLDFNFNRVLYYRFGSASSGVIDFGIYANTLFVILLGSLFWFKKLSKWWKILLIFSLLVDFSGAILSQSRTAWIGWPEAIIGWGSFYFYRLYSLRKYRQIMLFLMGITLLVTFLLLSPAKSIFEKRVNLIFTDVSAYQSGNPNTSLGMRFLMYEAALNQISETPYTGIGINNMQAFITKSTRNLAEEKYEISIIDRVYSQVHNQFLTSFLTGGILAFISLILLFSYLIFYFTKKIRQSHHEKQKLVAVAGLIFTITSLMTFMPESPLNFKVQFIFFFVVASLLLLVNEVEGEKNDN